MDAVTRHRIFSGTLMIALAMGWLAGGARHLAFALETTWGDLTGDLLVLGLALCFGAGVATRVVRPDRTQRWGIYGGLLMALAILAGTIAIDAVYVLPYHAGESGETWFSLLIELPFWVGMPMAVSAVLGWTGWHVASFALDRRRVAAH